jgi:hypothetical protein
VMDKGAPYCVACRHNNHCPRRDEACVDGSGFKDETPEGLAVRLANALHLSDADRATLADMVEVSWGSDVCDECDGSGTYYIDGEPQKCICSESQDDEEPAPGKDGGE